MFERRAITRIAAQDIAQNFFGIGVAIFKAIQAREPQRRIGIVRLDFQDGLEFFDRFGQIFLLGVAGALIAQRAHIDAGEQAVSVYVVRVEFQDGAGFFDRFA